MLSNTGFSRLFILAIVAFLSCGSDAYSLELSGMLAIEDIADSYRVDFSRLDTPQCAIGMRPDTVDSPDMILIHLYGSYSFQFLLRTPHTPSLDSTLMRFTESGYGADIDSLRKVFLPIAASVNPECVQSGQCDTAGGGFFVRTSENGVAFWRPVGMYIGGIDRYFIFWAYSSDGTFGGKIGAALAYSRMQG